MRPHDVRSAATAVLLLLPAAASADPRVPSASEATHGPFPLVVVDERDAEARLVGDYPGDDGPVPWELEAPVADWLGQVVSAGLSHVGVLATPAAEAGEEGAYRLVVRDFWCEAGSECRWSLRLEGRTDADWSEVWSQEASQPFHPEGQISADMIGAAVAWYIADDVRGATLPDGLVAPAVLAELTTDAPDIIASSGTIAAPPAAPAAEAPPAAEPVDIITSSGPIGASLPPSPPVPATAPRRPTYPDFDDRGYIGGMRLFGPPADNDCEDDKADRRSRISARERLGDQLYIDPERAWKDLRDYGPEGAELIADWLDSGARGARRNHVRDAARWVLKCAPSDRLGSALVYLPFDEDPRSVLKMVRGRIPRFTPERTQWFVDHESASVRAAGAVAMVGGDKIHSSTGFSVFFIRISRGEIPNEVPPPPQHHLDAVRSILEQSRDEGVWEKVVKSIGALYSHKVPRQQPWRELLVEVLQRAPTEWDGLLQDTALFIARAPCKGQPDVTDVILSTPIPDAHLLYVAGFEDRFEEEGLVECMVEPVRTMAESGLGVSSLDAKKLLRKMERQMDGRR